MSKAQTNGHASHVYHAPEAVDLNVLAIQGIVPVERFISELLQRLSPRTTQRLLLHYANELDALL